MKGHSYQALKKKFWLFRAFNAPLQWIGENWPSQSRLGSRELLFQNLVHKQLDRIGFDQPLYPVRCAAGYSFLYLVVRALEELPVRRVLELGAGESTHLLDHLCRLNGASCVTLEHDEFWASKIADKVTQQVIHAALERRKVLEKPATCYLTDQLDAESRFDLLLVDGPPGEKRHSRRVALEYIDRFMSEDFIIIFDDAERRGELDTIQAALSLIESKGWSYNARMIQSLNSQFLIAGGKFSPAFYF